MKRQRQTLAGLLGEAGFLLLWAIGIAIAVLAVASFGYQEGLFLSYFSGPWLLCLNLWPIWLSLCFLRALTRSRRLTLGIGASFWFALALANAIKVSYRHELLTPYDVTLFSTFLRILPRYMNIRLAAGALALTILWGLFLLVVRQLSPGAKPAPRQQLLIIVAIILAAVPGILPYLDGDMARELNPAATLDRWVDMDNQMKNGYVYSVVSETCQLYGKRQKPYDKKLAAALKERVQGAPIPEGKRPHVIVCLLESYKDFSGGVPFQKDPYAPFHALAERSYSGTLVPDTYGGGTIMTELEILTGFDLDVSTSLYKKPRPSYVRAFADAGYHTVGIHPNDGYFYNRANFYPKLGFERFLYTQNHFKNEDTVGDTALMEEVARLFRQEKAKGPLFFYVVTMGGHGPYDAEPLYEAPYVTTPEGPSGVAVNNYLAKMEETGEALLTLTDALAKESEPVILIAFGDHSPGFNDDMYAYLGWAERRRDPIERMATPYLIWGNESAKALTGVALEGAGPTIDPDFLMPVFFRLIGWPGATAYDAFMQHYSQVIQLDKARYMVAGGTLYHEPSEALLQLRRERAALEGDARATKLSERKGNP